MIAAWVMEPEVPRPAGDFLQHVTKRCFMEDRVDARILIKDLTLTAAASIQIEVIIHRIFSSDLLFIGTDGLDVDGNKGKFTFTEQRSLRIVNQIAEAPESDSARYSLSDRRHRKRSDLTRNQHFYTRILQR
jgi:hypothetical protein